MEDKKVYQALVDLSEVVYGLVSLSNNYSADLGEKLSKALTSINKCSPPTKAKEV